ncbi:hypothetical protein SH528x_002186 [Novipirellula sp. SH528]|uniref:hypothetical protein n=1 Tax=Novipirellula sp. SH528 TaxID=3454466 RepID=UPI003F9FB190
MDTPQTEIKHLKGQALERRMAELAKSISEEHVMCRTAEGVALEHARKAGLLLCEAKKRKGGSGKWGDWKRKLIEQLGAADRTMSQYMRVARFWDDPRIKATRDRGEDLSITKFINIVKRPPKPAPGAGEDDEHNESIKIVRKDVRDEFAEYLRSLDSYEVGILYATLDDVLAVANADLKERVCGAYEGPYYRDRDEYHREQAAQMHRPTPEDESKKKRKRRSDYEREGERAANADMKAAKVEKWNSLPVSGNKEPSKKRPPRKR